MEMSPLTCLLFFYLLYKTSGLHISVRLYSYRSQKTSKFDKTSVTRSAVLREPLTCIRRLLSAIPLQMHGNTESIC